MGLKSRDNTRRTLALIKSKMSFGDVVGKVLGSNGVIDEMQGIFYNARRCSDMKGALRA